MSLHVRTSPRRARLMAGTVGSIIPHTIPAIPAHRHLRAMHTGQQPSTIRASRRNRSIISNGICSRVCKSWIGCAVLRRRFAQSIPRSCTVWTNIRFTSVHRSARRPVPIRRTEAVCPRSHHRTTHRRCHYASIGQAPVPARAPVSTSRQQRRNHRILHSMPFLIRTHPFRH